MSGVGAPNARHWRLADRPSAALTTPGDEAAITGGSAASQFTTRPRVQPVNAQTAAELT